MKPNPQSPRAVPCPDCHALVGDVCTSLNGVRVNPHASRVRMGKRVAVPAPEAPRALVTPTAKAEGGVCPTCGATVVLMAWINAKNFIEWDKTDLKSPRLRQHEVGGSAKHRTMGKSVRCMGSYAVPVAL